MLAFQVDRGTRPRWQDCLAGTKGLARIVLLLAAMACVSEKPFIDAAAAQSSPAELNSAQRRLLAARLKDRLEALQGDTERGRKRVLADLSNWKGDKPSALTDVFDGKKPARSIPDVADNIYEKTIKEYIAFKRMDRPKAWNPWPDEDMTVNDQRKYAKCVLARVNYFFQTKWEYLNLLIAAIKKNEPIPQLNDPSGDATTLRKAIREALTFNGGIHRYLGNIPFSQALAERPDEEELDPLRRCPVELDSGDASDTSVGKVALSVQWDAKCLQSDVLLPGGKVKPYHPTTAALMYDNGRAGIGPATYCSGTLIAPNAVLTAAHCICETAAKDPRGQFYRTAAACVGGGYSRLGQGVSTLDPRHQTVFLQHAGHFNISHIVVHPQFRWTDELPSSDLAILFLERPVPEIAPMPLNSLRRLPPNTRAAAVGYGAHNPIDVTGLTTDTTTVLESAGLKLQANIITGFCSPNERSRKLICWSYRQADQAGMNLGSTCRGDSGGPLYADSGGQTYLVGVTSAGGPSCQPQTAAYDIEVHSYRAWIQRQLMMNPPSQRGSSLLSPPPARGDGLTQVACHFCSLCDQLQATIKTPPNARRVQVSVNCTPDEVTRRSELKLEVSVGASGNLCPTTAPAGTAVDCPLPVAPNQELNIKLNAGLLQQCQIVATSFDRRN